MARKEARISADIWADPDFRALDALAQRMYFLLLSQPDLTHTGVIPLRPRRWAQACAGYAAVEVERDLKALAQARFIVMDEDTGELLIRSFMRRDKVYRQPNVLQAAIASVPTIESHGILLALATELERILVEDPAAIESTRVDSMLHTIRWRLGCSDQLFTPPFTPSVTPSPTPSGRGLGVRGKGLGSSLKEDSETDHEVSDPRPPRPRTNRTADDSPEFARFWAVYPRREAKGAARKAWATAICKSDPEMIIAAAERYRDSGIRLRAEPKYTKHPSTWLNSECWTDEPLTPHPQGADRRMHESADLIARLDAMSDAPNGRMISR